jgi:hypothetical protein
MPKFIRIFYSLTLLACAQSWGMYEARLLKQSATGQTVLFNLGRHEGVTEGDYAVVVKQIHDLNERTMRIVPAAKAKNIKINSDSSVWILYSILDKDLLKNGEKFLILSETDVMKGRRDPRFGRLTTVSPKGYETQTAKNALSDDADRLSRRSGKYEVSTMNHEKESRLDGDGQLVDVEKWEKTKDTYHRSALYKSPSQAEFQKQMRVSTFEKMVSAYLRKVNEPNFSYDRFYDEQMKSEVAQEFRKRPVTDSEYQKFLLSQSDRKTADAKVYRALLEKGETWSEDFTDEELSGVLKNVSVLQEKDRREYLRHEAFRYTVTAAYNVNLSDPQTGADKGYRRNDLYAAEVSFEATPFLKQPTLERLTVFLSARLNKSAFEEQNTNLRFDDRSIAGGLNWYPLYAPYEYQAPVIFLGMYFRTGFGNLESPLSNEKANYSVTSFPGFQAGIRYNFRNKIGVRLLASLETLQIERFENNKAETILPESASLSDGKFGMGLSYSF